MNALDTFEVNIGCASKTRMKDSTCAVTVHSTDTTSFCRLVLRVAGDPISNARGQAGVQIALSTLSGWIPVNNRLCPVWLDGFVYVNTSQLSHRSMFVVSVNGVTVCSSLEVIN